MKLRFTVFVAALSLANVGAAAVIEYNDRAAFEAALDSLTLLEFEGLGEQVNLGTSVDFGDLNVSNPGNVWAIDGGFGSPSGQIGDQNNGDTLLTLQPGYRALGMDMGLLFGAGQINVTLRDQFDNVVASGLRAVADNDDLGLAGSTFYGWISDSASLSQLQLDSGGFPTIDNVILGNGQATASSRATFAVTKAFSDGNDDEVEVMLSCNNGLPLEQSFTISEGNPVFFVITEFTPGEADCEITETGASGGYTPSYDNGSVVSSVSCAYDDIASTNYSCAITNAADPATFTVTKDWVIEGAVRDEVIEEAQVTIDCSSDILSIDDKLIIEPDGSVTAYLSGNGDSVTVTVDTTLGSTSCSAYESIFQTGIESENNCGSRSIAAGGSSSCTITNTVFFEGIPTLSQYGMALMALLMLGLGFVGLRRFV